ncbi:MAG: hypothetical protein ACR2MF_07275 [Chthoniobacterales bacterium]
MFNQRLMLPARILSYAYDALRTRLRPQSLEAPEALPYVFYDTATYLAAGSTHLDFFRTVQSDLTLGNLEIAGSLPEGQFFDIHRIFITPLRVGTIDAAAGAGVAKDVQTILNIARATFTITTNAKPLGPIPARFFGDAGQATIVSSGTSATAAVQWAGFPANGGFPVNSAIRLGPAAKFGVAMDFVSTAVAVDTPLQVSLLGVLYRKIG